MPEHDVDDIRLGEVAVVVRILLAAHIHGGAGVGVEVQRLLHHMSALFQDIPLALSLIVDGGKHGGEGVEVLHLRPGTQLLRARPPEGQVHVAAEGTFLHAAVGYPGGAHDALELLQVLHRFLAGADVRLRDDLDEGHAAPIVVDEDLLPQVHQLARVLLHMDAGDADLFAAVQLDVTVLADGHVVLADLVRLGQIRVNVVLSVHLAHPVDLAVRGEPRRDGVLHHPLVHHGEAARLTGADGAAVGVGLPSELGGAGAEDLRLCGQLHVGLQPDDHFPAHSDTPLPLSFTYAPPVPVSMASAAERIRSSVNLSPMSCMPMGMPSPSKPQGTDTAGSPAIFTETVQISV